MSGTAVAVNVQSVRLIVDDISVSAEGIKYALRNGGSASVGAVEANLLTLKGSRSDGDQVTDIAVSSRCKERKYRKNAGFCSGKKPLYRLPDLHRYEIL